jgi:hypothetical protein
LNVGAPSGAIELFCDFGAEYIAPKGALTVKGLLIAAGEVVHGD